MWEPHYTTLSHPAMTSLPSAQLFLSSLPSCLIFITNKEYSSVLNGLHSLPHIRGLFPSDRQPLSWSRAIWVGSVWVGAEWWVQSRFGKKPSHCSLYLELCFCPGISAHEGANGGAPWPLSAGYPLKIVFLPFGVYTWTILVCFTWRAC